MVSQGESSQNKVLVEFKSCNDQLFRVSSGINDPFTLLCRICTFIFFPVKFSLPRNMQTMGPPKPTFLEVCMVNNLVIRWPKLITLIFHGFGGSGANFVSYTQGNPSYPPQSYPPPGIRP